MRGLTRNVVLGSTTAADADESEAFRPVHIDRRNGRTTVLGNWRKRDGMLEKYDLGVKEQVQAIVDFGPGYAITEKGKVFRLGASPVQLSASLEMTSRPRWTIMDNTLILSGGGAMVKVSGDTLAAVGGSPPAARYLALLNTQVLAAGHDRVQWRFSGPGNFELWDGADTKEVESTDESLTELRVKNRKVYIWKTRSGEIWDNVGGTDIFVRSAVFNRGTPAPDSVVEASDLFFWWGNDGNFYRLQGSQAVAISIPMRRELDTLKTTDDCYGFDFRAENVICWFFPTHGRCFVYDYAHDQWSEDNVWRGGGWHRLPVGSYGEVNGERLIGDYEPTGKIYRRDIDATTDVDDHIRVMRRFSVRLSDEGKRSRLNRAQFRVLRGQATDTEVDPEFFVRWRFDRGQWSNLFNYSLGRKGDHDPYVDIANVGVGREVMFEIVETDASRWLVTDLNITARELGR